jgi:hypothetical protein
MVVAIFGLGAYQATLSGRGGVHHCLVAEPRRLIIEDSDGGLAAREKAPRSPAGVLRLLGYDEPIGRTGPQPIKPRAARSGAFLRSARAARRRGELVQQASAVRSSGTRTLLINIEPVWAGDRLILSSDGGGSQ